MGFFFFTIMVFFFPQQPLNKKKTRDFNGCFSLRCYLLPAPQLCTSNLPATKGSQASVPVGVLSPSISLFFASTLDKQSAWAENSGRLWTGVQLLSRLTPPQEWICFIKLNNKCLRGLDIRRLSSSFTLESYRAAPYGAIPYCIMQCCNRLRLHADLQGGVLGWLWWLTSLSLPPSEPCSCWGINFLLPRFSTNLGRHEQWER